MFRSLLLASAALSMAVVLAAAAADAGHHHSKGGGVTPEGEIPPLCPSVVKGGCRRYVQGWDSG